MTCDSCNNGGSLGPGDIVKGAAAIAKNLLGVGVAPSRVVALRLLKCNGCEHAVSGSVPRRCGLCQCIVSQKARRADEKCPDGRW